MPLALPQSYSTGRVIRIPVAPQTVGDHIRKRRLGLKLLQKDVAEQLGVDKTSVFNWEGNRSSPEIRYMPAIIRFLATTRFRRRTPWPSSWSVSARAWGFRRRSPPDGSAWTPARWRSGSVGSESLREGSTIW